MIVHDPGLAIQDAAHEIVTWLSGQRPRSTPHKHQAQPKCCAGTDLALLAKEALIPIRRLLKGRARLFGGLRKVKGEEQFRSMQTIDKETEQLIKRIERAGRTARLQCLSQEEYRRRYYRLNPPGREQEVEVER
jgi:hypothetical protein